MHRIEMNSRREGFALPMAILLIGFLTAGLAGAFLRQSAELYAVTGAGSQTDAFSVAQEGLETYLAAGSVTQLTATYTFPDGTASVEAIQIKAGVLSTDTSIWLVKSTGTAKGGTRRNPAARRTVAQLASRAAPTMQVLSSWTSLSGLDKSGVSGVISGTDACGTGVVKAGTTVPVGQFSGHEDAFTGAPAIDQTRSETDLASAIKIDWAGITSAVSPSLAADIIYCIPASYGYNVGRVPCGAFPASTAFTADYWPTIIINGSSPLPADGHGMLIVTGNLDLNGGDTWDGIILVGGIITDNGNGGVGGAVVTGLNIKLGQAVEPSSVAHGTKDYAYDSCKVANATNGMARLNPVTNAWMDNWSAW